MKTGKESSLDSLILLTPPAPTPNFKPSEKDGERRVLRIKLVETELKTSAPPNQSIHDPIASECCQ